MNAENGLRPTSYSAGYPNLKNYSRGISQKLKSCAKRYHSIKSDAAWKMLLKKVLLLHIWMGFACVTVVSVQRRPKKQQERPEKTKGRPEKHTQLKNVVLADPLRVRGSYLVQKKDRDAANGLCPNNDRRAVRVQRRPSPKTAALAPALPNDALADPLAVRGSNSAQTKK